MKHHQYILDNTLEIYVSRDGDLFVQTDPLWRIRIARNDGQWFLEFNMRSWGTPDWRVYQKCSNRQDLERYLEGFDGEHPNFKHLGIHSFNRARAPHAIEQLNACATEFMSPLVSKQNSQRRECSINGLKGNLMPVENIKISPMVLAEVKWSLDQATNIHGTVVEKLLAKNGLDCSDLALRHSCSVLQQDTGRSYDALTLPIQNSGEIIGLYQMLLSKDCELMDTNVLGLHNLGYAILKKGRSDRFIVTEGIIEGLLLDQEFGEDHTVIATLSSKSLDAFIPPTDVLDDIIIGTIPDDIGRSGSLKLALLVNQRFPEARFQILEVPNVYYADL